MNTRTKKRRRLKRKFRCENLEDRRLLATVNVAINAPTEVPEDTTARLEYTLSRTDTEGFLAVQFELSGDAVFAVDYDILPIDPDTVQLPDAAPSSGPVVGVATFLPGESEVELAARPRTDAELEPDEEITLTVVEVEEFGPVNGGASLIDSGSDTVYYAVDTSNRLAFVDFETGVFDVVGTINVSDTLTDLAILEDGTFFAISANNLYETSPSEVSAGIIPSRFVAFHNIINANALVDARDGDFGATVGDLLVVGGNALQLHGINLVLDDGVWEYENSVGNIFDIAQNLIGQGFSGNYASSGDLDYLDDDELILSASPLDNFGDPLEYDALIEIETPGGIGRIRNAPVATQDPGEDFDNVFGLAFDGNDSYAFSGNTLLEVNAFNRDSSREMELTGLSYTLGMETSVTGTISGDFGEDTIGLYQTDESIFHLKEDFMPGAADIYLPFGPGGSAGWIPITGDWNGDGVDTIGLYEPATSIFRLKNSFSPGAADVTVPFGPAGLGWQPIAGDWNGDGVDTIGLYQPDISLFHLKNSFTAGASDLYFNFGPGGSAGWTPLVGDWDGDGDDTIGLYQPDISLFHLKNTFTPGVSDQYFGFGPGAAGWMPVTGDWNGDGEDTIGLYQPDISLFHLKNTFTPGASDIYVGFGPAGLGWLPLAGDWSESSSGSASRLSGIAGGESESGSRSSYPLPGSDDDDDQRTSLIDALMNDLGSL
ncbi:MAG: hypothetical protein AAFV88_19650 [Planctomycetota bacterium]